MSKKSSAATDARRPPSGRAEFVAGINPGKLAELLENHYTDVDQSHYRRLYHQSRRALLAQDTAAEHFAVLLESVDAAIGVEYATRIAGFIVGFDCCRQLMLGTLDLSTLKGGGK